MTIIVAGILEFDPARAEQSITTARHHIEGAYTEKGCVHYAWTLDPLNPGRVYVFEEWDTQEDLAAHLADHWYTDMAAHLGQSGLKSASVKKYRVDLSEPVYDSQGNRERISSPERDGAAIMKIGVFHSFMSPVADVELIGEFGRRAEGAGLDSIWLGEHVALFDKMEFPYPGSRDGRIPVPEGWGMLDPVSCFAVLAGVTSRIRLATGISLVAQRNPMYTAKEFATLDWLTRGRMDFGVGVGWCKEEVLACGYGWEDRGKRADEFLDLMRALWTEPVVTFKGQYVSVEQCRMDPKPIQSPHIPIIVGGHSKIAFRRAARIGAGWFGFALSPEQAAQAIAGVEAALAEAGRPREGFQIIVAPPARPTPDVVRAYADLGVERLVVLHGGSTAEKVLRGLDELGALVDAV